MIFALAVPWETARADELIGQLNLSSGLPVPGVEVKVCNKITRVCGTAYSNAKGLFMFSLPRGTFTLEAYPRTKTIRRDISVPMSSVLHLVVH